MNKKELVSFYCNQLANWISGGTLVNRGNLSSLGIRPLFSQIVTKTYIKKVISITNIPIDFNELLLEELNSIVFSVDKKSKVYLNNCNRCIDVRISSEDFIRKKNESYEAYARYESIFDSLNESEKITGKNIMSNGYKFNISKNKLDNIKNVYDSYQYVHSVIENNGRVSKSFFFIELLSPDQRTMSKIEKEVIHYLSRKRFKFKTLSANSSYYLENYAPASKTYEDRSKEFIPILLSDENLSYLQPFNSDGFIGNGSGQLLGMNAGSKTPLILNFFESGARQIILLSAPSGHGKTIQAFMLAISMLSSGVHVSALDVKGDEWVKLKDLLGIGVIIDIGEDSKTFVNTLRLDDFKIDSKEEAREYYNMAVNATSTIIELITKPKDLEEETQCKFIARESVIKLLGSKGVIPDAPKTFVHTRYLRYEDLITVMDTMKTSHSLKSYYAVIDKMKTLCNAKFRRSNVFKGSEISLNDVVDSPLVIYSLNKNSTAESDDEALKTFMISFLDLKKISIRKKLNKFTFILYEEMQRKKEFQSLMKLICGTVTGARSSNATIGLLCNSIQIMKDPDMAPISSNISTALIGPIVNEDDYSVLETIGCKDLEGKIRAISANPSKSKHFFAVKYDTGNIVGTAMCKCILPSSVTDKLKTRSVMSND